MEYVGAVILLVAAFFSVLEHFRQKRNRGHEDASHSHIARHADPIAAQSQEKSEPQIHHRSSEINGAGRNHQVSAAGTGATSLAPKDQKRWRFVAPFEIDTPLRILNLHWRAHAGQNFDPPDPPYWDPYSECWVLDKSGDAEKPMKPSDQETLMFLKAFRSMAESRDVPPDQIAERLLSFLSLPENDRFSNKFGGPEEIVDATFPLFIDQIVGVTSMAATSMKSAGLLRPQDLLAASGDDLLALKGVGPKMLPKIRQACEDAVFLSQARVERITR